MEVAVVHAEMAAGPPRLAFSTLVRPPVPIRPESSACHGLTDADVSAAPRWEDVAEEVLSALDGRVLLAYNLPFDWHVLDLGLERAGLSRLRFPFAGLDPFPWAATVHRYGAGKSLKDVARRYGVVFRGAHRAAEDARVTALLAPRLLRDLRDLDVPLETLRDAWEATVREAHAWEDGIVAHRARRKAGPSAADTPWRDLVPGRRK